MRTLYRKRRAPQGDLQRLRHNARESLHRWFREEEGTIPYKEVSRRLLRESDLKASEGALSTYYHRHYEEIVRVSKDGAAASPTDARTIVIRIEVPAGCHVRVATENIAGEEGA